MEKLSVISIADESGMLTGWIKDKPEVIAEGNSYVDLLEKLIEAAKIISEVGKD